MKTEKPIIGIPYSDSSMRDNEMRIRTYVCRKYYQSLMLSGAQTILLPPVEDLPMLMKYLDMVDGILLAGGEDVDPRFQNEDPHPDLDLVNPFRDKFEILITQSAYERKIPILGICRGVQVLAIALGGTIHQDIKKIAQIAHSQKAPRWATSHKVKLEKKSVLCNWFKSKEIFTNSFHHQSVRNVPDDFTVTGYTADNIIEAIEHKNRKIIGVQWHPEETYHSEPYSKSLFDHFVALVKQNQSF